MSTRIILKIESGSFASGFRVTLNQIEQGQASLEVRGNLPPNQKLFEAYTLFREAYFCQENIRSVVPQSLFNEVVPDEEELQRRLAARFRIVVPPDQITNPTGILHSTSSDLSKQFQDWLNLLTTNIQVELLFFLLTQKESSHFILQIQRVDPREREILEKLPWHNWHFFRDHNLQTEITVGQVINRPNHQSLGNLVRILAILGHGEGIDTHNDLQTLRQVWGSWVTALEQPSRKQMSEQLWQQSWDILYFAGHSDSKGQTGRIYINENQESLTLDELRESLTAAGRRGLKMAIFNSCDGLGLVSTLADANIPWIVVMREPVPDRVAQLFLRYFLAEFSQGKPFVSAIQEARHRLEGIQDNFPCATWLPIVYQSQSAQPLLWPRWSIWLNRCTVRVRYQLSSVKAYINRKLSHLWEWAIAHRKTLLLVGMMMIGLMLTVFIHLIHVQIFPLSERMSFGEKILVKSMTNPHKQIGVVEYQAKNYEKSIAEFSSSLASMPDDPEARIYFNNAKIGDHSSFAIAVSVPIGQHSDIAQEILRGVAQAQEELNHNGGIRGKSLKVKIINDDNDPDLAKQLAKQLVQDPQILAVVGHNASDVSIEAAQEYQGQLVMISPTSFAKGVTEGEVSNSGNYIYRTILNIEDIAKELVAYGIKTGLHKYAICSDFSAIDNRTYGNEFTSQLTKVNAELIDASCNLSAKVLKPQVQMVESAHERGAQGLFLAPYVGRIDAALHIAQANHRQLKLLGSPTLNTAQTLEKGGKAVEGMVLAVPWHVDNSPNKDFVIGADTLWKNRASLTWRSATAYDATQAIIRGLEQSNTRIELQKALTQTNLFAVRGATGEVRFLPNGDRQGGTVTLVQVQRDPQSAYGYRFAAINNGLRASIGQTILIQEKNSPDKDKEEGVQAFALGNYAKAQNSLGKSLHKKPNDPETRIYFNNARAGLASNPFKFAIAVPIGGRLSSAQEMLRGIAQAQEEFNQSGGITGQLLQVEILDDRSNEETGKSIATTLVADKSVLAVIGHNASEVSVEAAPIYQKGKLTMITPTTGTNKLRSKSEAFRKPSDANYIFRVIPSAETDARNLQKIIQAKKLKKLLICSDSESPYSQDILDKFVSVNSGIKCDFGSQNFNRRSIIDEAINRGVDGFMLTPSVIRIDQAIGFIQDAPREFIILGGSTIYTPKTLQSLQSGNKKNSLILAVAWHPESSPLNRDFFHRVKHFWSGDINWRTAMTYDATLTALEALRVSPTKTREGLQSVLSEENFSVQGAAGLITFSPLGDRKENPNLGVLVEAQCIAQKCHFIPWKPKT
jgi:branched-chain amino acid transport system substrate-binding protein